MAKYTCSANGSWITPTETSGSIQCQIGSIEISAINTDNTGIKIGQGDMVAFEGSIFVRSSNNKQAIFTTVPFDVRGGEGGGGGGTPYTLPTASITVKGGIKIGSGLTMTDEVLSADKQISDWADNTKYEVGDIAVIGGKLYQCNTAHTSSPQINMADWDSLYSDLPSWTSGTSYGVGSIVVNGNSIYKCTTANSDSIFNSSKWKVIGGGISIDDWASAKSYAVGDFVKYNNVIYVCNTAHTSTTFTADKSKWDSIKVEEMEGATSSANGKAGGVPAPTSSDTSKFLCGDGTWKNVSGGDGVQAARVTLFEGMQSFKDNTPVLLSDNINNYDILEFTISADSTRVNMATQLIDVKNIQNALRHLLFSGTPNYLFQAEIKFSDFTHFYVDDYTQSGNTYTGYVNKVVGIKYIQPDSYSTEEKLIGTWIDGKPLYQKTYVGTSTGSVAISIPMLIDKIISIDGCTKITGVDYPLNYYTNSTNYGSCVVGFDASSGTSSRVIYLTHLAESRSYLINVKYTKL